MDRQQAARYQINVADVQDAIQTAVGGNALTQVLQGEQRYDLVMRYLPQYRDTEGSDREHSLVVAHRRTSVAGTALQNPRRGTALPRSIAKAISAISPSSTACAAATWAAPWKKRSRKSTHRFNCPAGITSIGKVSTRARSEPRRGLLFIVPLTVFFIFVIIYWRFGSAKWACLNLVNMLVARVGGLLALLVTGTHFSVSSGVGFLALFGVSVQTGVIMVEYINQLRARGRFD